MTWCPLKIHVHLKLVNVALFGNSLYRRTQGKMGSYWIKVSLNPVTGVPVKRGNLETDT